VYDDANIEHVDLVFDIGFGCNLIFKCVVSGFSILDLWLSNLFGSVLDFFLIVFNIY